MVLVADFGADRAHADAVVHVARVAVVPVLVHELFLRHSERAQLVAERFLVLEQPNVKTSLHSTP